MKDLKKGFQSKYKVFLTDLVSLQTHKQHLIKLIKSGKSQE